MSVEEQKASEHVEQAESNEILRRFASKQSLYNHLTVRRKLPPVPLLCLLFADLILLVNFHLPVYRQCSVEFLQDILENKRSVINRVDMNTRTLPNYAEFSVASLLANQIDEGTKLRYFPRDPESVDRAFCWAVYETLQPDAADRFYHEVLDKKEAGKQAEERPRIKLSRQWLERLTKHAPKSKLCRLI